jgi:TPR repeat protein
MDEPLVDTELADSEPQRRSGPWKLIIIVGLLTLLGVWLVPEDPSEDAPPVAEQPTAPEPAPSLLPAPSGPDLAGDPSIDLPATQAGAKTGPPGTRARALIAEVRAEGDTRDLDSLFAAAEEARVAGEKADAYLLYFFAARKGHAASALSLGAQADPATRDPANSVFESADLTQAHKWYEMAAQSGDAEARARLADLRARVEQLADSGDVEAQRIALLWQ